MPLPEAVSQLAHRPVKYRAHIRLGQTQCPGNLTIGHLGTEFTGHNLLFLLRKPGQGELASPRREPDIPVIYSGVNAADTMPGFENKGYCNGTPFVILIPNLDRHFVHIEQYRDTNRTPRPGHASYASFQKYGPADDAIGAGIFSGRYTSTIVTAGYIANRHTLIAAVFGFAALGLFVRARREQQRAPLLAALGLYLLALLSSEASISIAAYLFAYVVCVEQGPIVRRLIGILPFALLTLAYLTWIAASLQVLPNTRGTILRVLGLLVLVGGGVGWFRRAELRRPRSRRP